MSPLKTSWSLCLGVVTRFLAFFLLFVVFGLATGHVHFPLALTNDSSFLTKERRTRKGAKKNQEKNEIQIMKRYLIRPLVLLSSE